MIGQGIAAVARWSREVWVRSSELGELRLAWQFAESKMLLCDIFIQRLRTYEYSVLHFLTKWIPFIYEKWILGESKMGHEIGQFPTDFDDFGVVGKPLTSALQRHQTH